MAGGGESSDCSKKPFARKKKGKRGRFLAGREERGGEIIGVSKMGVVKNRGCSGKRNLLLETRTAINKRVQGL